MREGIFQVQGGRKDRKNKKPQGTLHKERDGPAGLLLQPFLCSLGWEWLLPSPSSQRASTLHILRFRVPRLDYFPRNKL